MKWLNCEEIKVLLIAFMVSMVLGGSAKADFTFGEPTPLDPTINAESAWDPSISADGLSLYFASERPGGYGGSDIWVSTRQTTGDNWSEPVNLGPAINGTQDELRPSISTDELELYFNIGYQSIWVSTRETSSDPWGNRIYLGPPISGSRSCAPCISADGLELYFAAYDRPPHSGWYDIYVANRPTINDPWQEPVRLTYENINRWGNDNWPNISADGLVLFFYSGGYRGGYGGGDIWMSRRATVSDSWQEAVNLGSVINSAFNEIDSDVSSDGLMLYFGSSRPGGPGEYNIWQAPIVPIVDFNGDGCGDILDLVMLVNKWGTNDTLCDIGPMPWGDGIVDDADLFTLMSYWGEDINDPTIIANYKLDETEGDIACDSTCQNDAVIFGNAVWQPTGGVVDGAIELDGNDDCVSTPFILNPAEPFRIYAWIKGGAPGQVIISQANGQNWLLADEAEGKLTSELYPGRSKPLVSDVVITDGDWHRVGFTWDGSNRTLYVDDVEVATDTQNALPSSERGLYIGADKNLNPGSFFSGMIDDVRIYSGAITP